MSGRDSSSSSSKKRKHSAVEETTTTTKKQNGSSSSSIQLSVSGDANKDGLLPLLAAVPAISLPEETTFTLYKSDNDSNSSSSNRKKGKGKHRERSTASMLHGESSKLEWTSGNRLHGLLEDGNDDLNESNEDTECSTSYALALYDPSTSSLSMINAPLHILSHIPKRLKALPSMMSADTSQFSSAAARAELGLSFGTKKSIKAIRAAERNKVDAGAADLQLVQDVVMENLDQGLVSLPANAGGTPRKGYVPGVAPTEEELAEAKESEYALVVEAATKTGRPIPNITATRADDVYRLIGSIILEKELSAINVSSLMKFTPEEKEEAFKYMPYKMSTWVNDRTKEVIQSNGKDKRKKLKHLAWISALMAMKGFRGGVDPGKDTDLKKRFGGGAGGNVVPPPCSASLLERFAENIRGTRNLQMTTVSESRLLCFLFVACLAYDSYSNIDLNLLSNDLNIPPKRATDIFKSLGCRVTTPKGSETDKIVAKWQNEGRTGSVAAAATSGRGKVKVASLKIPLEFPRERKPKAKK